LEAAPTRTHSPQFPGRPGAFKLSELLPAAITEIFPLLTEALIISLLMTGSSKIGLPEPVDQLRLITSASEYDA